MKNPRKTPGSKTQIIQKSIPRELELLSDWNLSGFLIYGFPEYSTRERNFLALDFWSLFINLNHIHHKEEQNVN